MNQATRIALLAAVALLPYAATAFAMWDLDPAQWPQSTRAGVALATIWCVTFAALYLGTCK